MKKFLKGALVCSMMALVVPFLVGCNSTPAWQKVDYINTNASYDNEVEYSDVQEPFMATGESELTTMTGKVKIASEMSGDGYYMILAGVVDTSTEGEDDDVKAAVKMNLTMTFFETTISTNIIFYVTKDLTYYLNMFVSAGGRTETMKIKATAQDIAPLFSGEGSSTQSPSELIDNLRDINTIANIIEIFELEFTDLDKFIYGIATDDETGVTKYIMTLKDGETITESVEMMGQQVQGTLKKGVAYMAVKDNIVIEVYQSTLVEVNSTDMSMTTSIKEYNEPMPAHGDGYLTMAEYIESAQ